MLLSKVVPKIRFVQIKENVTNCQGMTYEQLLDFFEKQSLLLNYTKEEKALQLVLGVFLGCGITLEYEELMSTLV